MTPKAVSIPLPIFFALLTRIGSQALSQEYTTPNVSKQISPNLELFFEQTMQGCTIRIVFDGRRGLSEDVFVTKTSQQSSFQTFIVDEYKVFKESILHSYSNGQFVEIDKYSPQPQWLLKKFTVCYTHLYIAEDESHFQTLVRHHFVDFDLRKEDPDYVIIWDVHNFQSLYGRFFSQQEFYRSFMDYRLVIKRDLSSSMFDVSLVCILCPERFPQGLISPPITPATSSNIHEIWRNVHSNHFGMPLACMGCPMPYHYSQLKYRKSSFQWLIAKLTNATLTLTKNDVFYSIGEITLDKFLTPKEVPEVFTNVMHPQYTMSPSFLTAYENKMFTVVHKNLLVAPGLKEFVAPFTQFAWWCFALSLLCIYMLYRTIAIKLRYSSLFLSIFGPLTDHWTQHFNPMLQRIFLLWGILCYSVTILYGGELASSLAVLKPPEYPISVMELLDMRTTIFSLSGIGTGTNFRSKLADSLASINLFWTEARTGDANIDGNKVGRLESVISKANLGYCEWKMQVCNRSNKESPFLCRNKPYVSNPDKPITFLDNRYIFLLERYVFQDSSLYWVSSASRVPELQDQFPLILSKNYLAKLVLPISSFWAASGLNDVWNPIHEKFAAAIVYSEKQTVINADMDGESTRVIDFTPASLHTTVPAIILSAIFLGVALTIFLLESLGTFVVSSVSLDKLWKLYSTAKWLQTNQITAFPEAWNVRVANPKHFNSDEAIEHKQISPELTCHNAVVQIKVLPKSNEDVVGTTSCEYNRDPKCELSEKTAEGFLKPQRGLRFQDVAQSIRQRLRRQVLNKPTGVVISSEKESSDVSFMH